MATERTESVTKGYSPDILVTMDTKYTCPLCDYLLESPVQNRCGHRYCRRCLECLTAGRMCPRCEEEGDSEPLSLEASYPDPAIARELAREPAACRHQGCTWSGQFRDYRNHAETCDHRVVTCDCGVSLAWNKYESHLANQCNARKTKCFYCKSHVCANPSDVKSHGDAHDNACPFGCPSYNTEGHQQEAVCEHLMILLEKVVAVERELHAVKLASYESLELRIRLLEANATDVKQKIEGIRVQGQPQSPIHGQSQGHQQGQPQGQSQGQSQERREGKGVNHSQGQAERQDDGVGFINDRLDTTEALTSTIHTELTDLISAQLNLTQRLGEDKGVIRDLQERVASLERSLAARDTVLAESEVKLSSLSRTSYNGTFVWAITEVNRKRNDAISGVTQSLWSPVFYTSRAGYKCCARLYLNGDGMGKGSHISLFFVVMRGQYDAILPWPFKQKVTLSILDQGPGGCHVTDSFRPDPTSSSFRRPRSDMNFASGVPLFLPLRKLTDPVKQYVKDDIMFVKVTIDTNGLD